MTNTIVNIDCIHDIYNFLNTIDSILTKYIIFFFKNDDLFLDFFYILNRLKNKRNLHPLSYSMKKRRKFKNGIIIPKPKFN